MKKTTKKKVDPYLLAVGEKITALMKSKSVTQLEMAKKLKTKNTQIRRIQQGVTNPTLNTLREIADVLGVAVHELLKVKVN